MKGGKRIPALHQAIAAAAVKAALGERAVIRQMMEVPSAAVPGGVPRGAQVVALQEGIRTFWSRWTGRQSNRSSITDETPD
jgi:hypothetical protein